MISSWCIVIVLLYREQPCLTHCLVCVLLFCYVLLLCDFHFGMFCDLYFEMLLNVDFHRKGVAHDVRAPNCVKSLL